jgi:hypothetical protein
MAGVPRSSYLVFSGGAACDAVHRRGAGQIHRWKKRDLLQVDNSGFVWKESHGEEDCGETISGGRIAQRFSAPRWRWAHVHPKLVPVASMARRADVALFRCVAHDGGVFISSMHPVGRTTVLLDAWVGAQPSFRIVVIRIDELSVLPIFPRSLLRVAAEFKEVLVHESCTLWSHAASESFVAWQPMQGLPNLLESIVREHFGAAWLGDSTSADDHDNTMVLNLVTRYTPEATEELAERTMTDRVNQAYELFTMDDGYKANVDAMLYVGERSDQQIANDWVCAKQRPWSNEHARR